jgi:polyhydroxyalkanoate synthesis regulator phasin
MATKKAHPPTSPGELWQAGLGAFTKAQAEAASKLATMATDLSSKATGHIGKLESIFVERVAKALHTLGVPSAEELGVLSARVDELSATVQKLSATRKIPAKRSPRKPK